MAGSIPNGNLESMCARGSFDFMCEYTLVAPGGWNSLLHEVDCCQVLTMALNKEFARTPVTASRHAESVLL